MMLLMDIFSAAIFGMFSWWLWPVSTTVGVTFGALALFMVYAAIDRWMEH